MISKHTENNKESNLDYLEYDNLLTGLHLSCDDYSMEPKDA